MLSGDGTVVVQKLTCLLVVVSFMSMQRLTHGRTGPDEGVLSLPCSLAGKRWLKGLLANLL